MASNLMAKCRESLISVAPVMGIVLLLHFLIAPLPPGLLPRFILGGALIIIGLGIFLLGADLGMVPFGQRLGSALTHRRNLPLILGSSLAIGFAVTIAEPDVQVLAEQVSAVNPAIAKTPLLLMIALGVGIFVLIGTARVVLRVPLRKLLILFYALVFLICSQVDSSFIGVAFDSGGATTGPVTVPFIMALGIGVAAGIKKDGGNDDNSFGLVGLASIGPIAAVAIMGLISRGGMHGENPSAPAESAGILEAFWHELPLVAADISLALLPIILIFIIFHFTLLRLPPYQLKRIIIGFCYTFIGLLLFMTGVNGGFTITGQALGTALGALGGSLGGGKILLPVGFGLGAVVVCAEPAVWVLTEQIEEISGGSIRRPIMLAALSISIACAVSLGMLRVLTSLSIWWILVPGYAAALALTFISPPLFTAIAFDSGGVASGPMATTFVLSLTLGASASLGGNPITDAFGMIAMIAMAPLITIQLLGLMFKNKEKQQLEKAKSLGVR